MGILSKDGKLITNENELLEYYGTPRKRTNQHGSVGEPFINKETKILCKCEKSGKEFWKRYASLKSLLNNKDYTKITIVNSYLISNSSENMDYSKRNEYVRNKNIKEYGTPGVPLSIEIRKQVKERDEETFVEKSKS